MAIVVSVGMIKEPKNNVIGMASMVVDGKFAFNSMKIVKSDRTDRGFFVSMPSYRTKEGDYIDLYHPISSEMMNAINEAVGLCMKTGEKQQIGTAEEKKFTTYVTPVSRGDSSTVAKVNLKCGDMVCNNVSLRKNEDGQLFVGYPGYASTKEEGKYESYCNPTTAEFKSKLQEQIISQYDKVFDKKYAVSPAKQNADARQTAKEPQGINVNVRSGGR